MKTSNAALRRWRCLLRFGSLCIPVAALLASAGSVAAAPPYRAADFFKNPDGSAEAVWRRSTLPVPLYFHESVPKGQFRDRVAAAARQWRFFNGSFFFRTMRRSNLAGSIPAGNTCNDAQIAGRKVGRAYYTDIQRTDLPGFDLPKSREEGNVAAFAYFCPESDPASPLYRKPATFSVFIDTAPGDNCIARDGYTPPPDCVPAKWWVGAKRPGRAKVSPTSTFTTTRPDLQSIITHELGHATGFQKHYDGPGGADSGYAPTARDVCHPDSSARQTMCQTDTGGKTWWRTLGKYDLAIFREAYRSGP